MIFLYGLYLVWAVFAFGGGRKKMASETHILPKGFIGQVHIYFNQSNGKEIEYNGKSRIYRIPKSGILKTKFISNSGWIDSKEYLNFFYGNTDSTNLLHKYISSRDSIENIDSNTIIVFEYGIGTVWDKLEGDINVTTYIVDSLKNINKRHYKFTKEMFENWNK